jgi:hypothetical protein
MAYSFPLTDFSIWVAHTTSSVFKMFPAHKLKDDVIKLVFPPLPEPLSMEKERPMLATQREKVSREKNGGRPPIAVLAFGRLREKWPIPTTPKNEVVFTILGPCPIPKQGHI